MQFTAEVFWIKKKHGDIQIQLFISMNLNSIYISQHVIEQYIFMS